MQQCPENLLNIEVTSIKFAAICSLEKPQRILQCPPNSAQYNEKPSTIPYFSDGMTLLKAEYSITERWQEDLSNLLNMTLTVDSAALDMIP